MWRTGANMPKRMRDNNKSIFVKFYEDVSDQEVNAMLADLGISGGRVSSIVNRWVLEIPFWKEGFFIERFSEGNLVETIHESFDKKRKTTTEEQGEDNE